MAPPANSTTHPDRRLLVVALCVLGAVTGLVFGRVFLGTHPAIRLAVAGAAAVALAALAGRRSLLVSILASAAGLVVALGLLVFPDTTIVGLPGPDTLSEIVEAMGRVGRRAAIEIAPAPPLPSLLTASIIAVWTASAAVHALAIRAGSTVLPLLPGGALLAFVGVVTQEPPRPGYVLLFLAAAFFVLFAEAIERTGAMGAGRTRFSGRWARAIGGTAAIVAIAIPGVLPGFGSEPILQLNRQGRRIHVNPVVDIRPSLLQNPAAQLFSVEANRPAYWRMLVLDQFDGRLWRSSDPDHEAGVPIEGFSSFTDVVLPSSPVIEQEYRIDALATSWLPMAAEPVRLATEDVPGRYDDIRGTVALEAETADDMEYRVESALQVPSVTGLQRSDPASAYDTADGRPLDVPLSYVDLPEGLPTRIREIAAELTSSAETPFEEMIAIQEHLREFRYDEQAPAGHGNSDILFFLEQSRTGYCEQFAASMAVLARTLGYPARVAIGFQPGDLDRSGRYRVTTQNAHAWPEIFFPPYGWLAFEPTPSRSNPAANYLVRLPSDPRPDANFGRGAPGEPNSTSGVQQREEFQRTPLPEAPGASAGTDPGPAASPWRLILSAALALALAAALVVPPAKAAARRLSVRRAGTPRDRVLAAYRWLLAGASDLGIGRRRAETLLQYRARLRTEGAPQDPLDRLTGLTGHALYSAREMRPEHGEVAVEAAEALLAELRRHAGPVRTAVGAFRPSGFQPAGGR